VHVQMVARELLGHLDQQDLPDLPDLSGLPEKATVVDDLDPQAQPVLTESPGLMANKDQEDPQAHLDLVVVEDQRVQKVHLATRDQLVPQDQLQLAEAAPVNKGQLDQQDQREHQDRPDLLVRTVLRALLADREVTLLIVLARNALVVSL